MPRNYRTGRIFDFLPIRGCEKPCYSFHRLSFLYMRNTTLLTIILPIDHIPVIFYDNFWYRLTPLNVDPITINRPLTKITLSVPGLVTFLLKRWHFEIFKFYNCKLQNSVPIYQSELDRISLFFFSFFSYSSLSKAEESSLYFQIEGFSLGKFFFFLCLYDPIDNCNNVHLFPDTASKRSLLTPATL